MPAPTTSGDFLEIVHRSGLIHEDRFNAFLRKYQFTTEDASKVAIAMVQDGLITNFQARQLLKGRYRGFAIGKYLVLEQLGEGGMGKVFLCEHMLMRRRVAIKVLSRDLASDPGTVERFQREGRAVASLDHPNIVRAHDVDSEGDNHFIVMEYVDGSSLHEVVRRKGPLPVNRACHYISQAAIGLQAVFEAGMIHRDIKPGNLLLDRKGQVKVLDLGLARFDHEKRESLTQKFDEGSVLGTADYLSPEQAMDSHEVDIRCDIYSLGATMYFMLVGRPPFEGGSVTQKLLFHQLRNPEPLKGLRPDLPDALVAIVEKMMAKDPKDRYQTPIEVAAALEPWTRTPIPPPSDDEMPRLCLAAQRAGTPEAGPLPNLAAVARDVTPSRTNLNQQPYAPGSSGVVAGGRYGPGANQNHRAPVDASSSNVMLQSGVQPSYRQTASGRMVPNKEYDSKVGPPSSPSSLRRRSASRSDIRKRRRRTRFWLILAVVVLVFGGTGYLFWPKGKTTPREEMVLVVSKTRKGPNIFRTLTQAWQNRDPARTGRIRVEEKEINEEVRLVSAPNDQGRNWIIEGRANWDSTRPTQPNATGSDNTEGTTVTWKGLDRASGRPLLSVENVSNVHITGFIFDAESNQSPAAVVLSGACPGLMLRSSTIRNVNKVGLKLANLSGLAQRNSNVQILNVDFTAAKDDAVAISIEGGSTSAGFTRYITMFGCNTEVKSERAKRFQTCLQIMHPTEGIAIDNCKFRNAVNGMMFRRESGPFQPIGITLLRTEFRDLDRGIRFETLERNDQVQLKAESNSFYNVKRMSEIDDLRAEPAVVPARWIWYPEEGSPLESAPQGVRYFRRVFEQSTTVTRATLQAICDDQCKIWINNKLIATLEPSLASGQVASIEIADKLTLGKNVICVEAENKTAGTPAGLLVLLMDDAGGAAFPPVFSDNEWLTSLQAPPGWTSVEFKAQDWVPALELSEYGHSRCPSSWRRLTWSSEIKKRFQGKEWSPITARENQRDHFSAEGFPSFESKIFEAKDAPRLAGQFLEYMVVGPFGDDLDQEYGPEIRNELTEKFKDKEGRDATWVQLATRPSGYLDLKAHFKRQDRVSAYVMIYLNSPKEQKMRLLFGADDRVKVWHDGKMIHRAEGNKLAEQDQYRVEINLQKGYNQLIFKVANNDGEWGMFARMLDAIDVRYALRKR